jgi:hypothetical protein
MVAVIDFSAYIEASLIMASAPSSQSSLEFKESAGFINDKIRAFAVIEL